MDVLLLIGRILFAILFISSGVMGHLVGRVQLTGYAESKGIPMAGPAVILSGIGIILGGIGIAAGIWIDVSALVIAVFCSSLRSSSIRCSGGRPTRWRG